MQEKLPRFFGSALNNFGLDVFLQYFHQLAPPPQGYEYSEGVQESWMMNFRLHF